MYTQAYMRDHALRALSARASRVRFGAL